MCGFYNDKQKIKKGDIATLNNKNIIIKSATHIKQNKTMDIVYIDDNKLEKLIAGITIFKLNRSFHVIERIDAAMARQINETDWRLSNVVWRTFEKGKPIVTFRYAKRIFKFPRLSKVSEEAEKQTKEMSYARLRDYINRHSRETDKETLNRYYVDLYTKTAYPFGGIIMVLIAIPFALKMGRTGGISVSLGVAIGIGILYHILASLFSSIGYAGLLNGFLAAWSAGPASSRTRRRPRSGRRCRALSSRGGGVRSG